MTGGIGLATCQQLQQRNDQFKLLPQPAELRASNDNKSRHRHNVRIAEEGDLRKRLKNLRIIQRTLDAVNPTKMLKLCTGGPCWASKTLAMGDSKSEQRLWHAPCAASLLHSLKTSFELRCNKCNASRITPFMSCDVHLLMLLAPFAPNRLTATTVSV